MTGRLEQTLRAARDGGRKLLVPYVTGGLKGTEVQPRISLTHVWDAPPEFWNSSADTGWMAEAYPQAINILRTDYAGDVAEARR